MWINCKKFNIVKLPLYSYTTVLVRIKLNIYVYIYFTVFTVVNV
jgi:hypothetical protein